MRPQCYGANEIAVAEKSDSAKEREREKRDIFGNIQLHKNTYMRNGDEETQIYRPKITDYSALQCINATCVIHDLTISLNSTHASETSAFVMIAFHRIVALRL